MSGADQRPIIDAGPSLNFLSIRKERLLFGAMGRLCAPQVVADEVLRKSRKDARFEPAAAVWRKVEGSWVDILADEATPDLERAVTRICGLPLEQRMRSGNDLGETMVVAHAAVQAEAGSPVMVLIDDQGGVAMAAYEAARLERLREQGKRVGRITVATTVTVLQGAVTQKLITDKGELRRVYEQLRGLDDGLLPIDHTGLLAPELWRR
ncbi:hypothetical protein ACWEOW_18955 [Monashia sp. NPDC004114]